jgi:hypothetical protein
MAAKKHQTEGKVAAEAARAAAPHEAVRARPKRTRPLRLEARKGMETAAR